METQHAERIFLIGPTGSGKTTVGRIVAELLGWDFTDTDAIIATTADKPIPQIFADDGEQRFRDMESSALRDAATHNHVVVATGAGIVERAINRDSMHAIGYTVSLDCSPETALQRLTHEASANGASLGDTRPMLATKDALSRMHELQARRHPSYLEADSIVSTDLSSAEEAARAVVATLVCNGVLPANGAIPFTRNIATKDGTSYQACVEWGGLAHLGESLAALAPQSRIFLCIDENVARLYEPTLLPLLRQSGNSPLTFLIPSGEQSKSSEQLDAIYDWLAENRAERRDLLVAIGGGVVGDLAGFAAATYLRGMPLLHVPTTLLAQVDSSLGGKTGINHSRGKNLIGAFYPPRLVLTDPAVLLTLPERQRIEGWAEVIKHGVALDHDYFLRLERDVDALLHMEPAALTAAIAGSVEIKGSVVEGDERETDGGRRLLLNYGHTIGHAIEAVTGYGAWLHGEAVAVGMVAAARLGQRIGVTPDEVIQRQEALLTRVGLPIHADGLSIEALLQAALWDKKVSGGRVRWVLPTNIGTSKLVSDVADADVRAALKEIGAVE